MITNQRQFDEILIKKLSDCVEYLSQKIYECLYQHILDDVYYSGGENFWYNNGTKEPTWEFLNSFEFEGIKKNINEVTNTLFYNWMSMSSPNQSNPYVHGNYNEGIDRRESLAEILNVYGESPSGTFDLRNKKRNAFWDEALKEVNQNFDKWANEACNKYLK